jgi:hypothetical protein
MALKRLSKTDDMEAIEKTIEKKLSRIEVVSGVEREDSFKIPDEWAEEVKRKPRKIPFNFQMEEHLYYRLKKYVLTKARRHESMAYLINRAVERYLNEIEKERD